MSRGIQSRSDANLDLTSELHARTQELRRIPDAVYLVRVVDGPDEGQSYRLDGSAASRVLLGQGPACEFRLNDRAVSRRHLSLDIHGSRVRMTDLHSTNGTLVDGMSVLDCFLRGGELIKIGETTLKLERHDAAAEVHLSAADRFGKLLGGSVEMRRLYPLCEQLAAVEVPVIIEGETGTGKEVLAESIHRESARASGPFVVFDCTAVPASLVEAELFGYEDSVFGERAGVFEQAAGGTLLIDEIGDLELSIQPRVLRAIERREIQRVGATSFRPVDVRVICASRRDLDHAVQTQRFRDDLFHRLAVARIELPPLRDRVTDIPQLAAEFARELGSRDSLPKVVLNDWMSMSWPGNVRELRNTVARYLAMGAYSQAVTSDDLASGTEGPVPEAAEWIREALELPLSEARQRVVDEFEKQYIERLLRRHGGNVTRAAAAAGVVRRHFQTLKARVLKP